VYEASHHETPHTAELQKAAARSGSRAVRTPATGTSDEQNEERSSRRRGK
jgi:hypothetical protein